MDADGWQVLGSHQMLRIRMRMGRILFDAATQAGLRERRRECRREREDEDEDEGERGRE